MPLRTVPAPALVWVKIKKGDGFGWVQRPAARSASPTVSPAAASPRKPKSPPAPAAAARYNMRPRIVKPKWAERTDMVAYGKHARASENARAARAARK